MCGNNIEALEICDQFLEKWRKFLGEANPSTLQFLQIKGKALLKLERNVELAHSLLKKASQLKSHK